MVGFGSEHGEGEVQREQLACHVARLPQQGVGPQLQRPQVMNLGTQVMGLVSL